MAQPAPAAERKKRTIQEIRDSKTSGEKMVYMSVPDYTAAKWAETAGVDVAVVGDSLAMIAHGHPNTIPATMDMMAMHAAAIRRGAPNTFVLGCMPYQSYHTVDRALQNATRFMQEAACDAVKPQGGKSQAHILKALVDAGIPTASHIGLTPHTVAMFGGFRIQGRSADAAMKILEDALAIQDAGCFMLEFEAVPGKIARVISEQLEIPTIGIGAGVGTDGQILLCHDLLGVFTDFKPKFTKRYANLTEVAVTGIKAYIADVKGGTFPDDDHTYGVASVTDALLLARHADIVVYVVHHNKVDKKVIKRTVASLRKVTPNLLGGVLNAVNVKVTGDSYSYYYPTLDDGVSPRADVPTRVADEEAIPGVVGASSTGTKS